MLYVIPHTTCEVHKVLPNTHISFDTAYVVADYPYGFKLRCEMRYWLEYNENKGFRLWSCSSNPKHPGTYNKPKASTYARFGGAMFLDQNGHVKCTGLTEYTNAEEAEEYMRVFLDGVPEAGQGITKLWAQAKRRYEERKKELV